MDQTPSTGMPVAAEPKSKKGLIIGAIVVLALAIGGYLFMKNNDADPNGVAAGDDNALVINDQEVAMLAVFVESVSTRVPAYIVIHNEVAGKPGAIVANSQLLQPGSYEKISFVAKLEAGATYYGMLHGDNGNGAFDAATDTEQLMTNDGAEIMVKFMAKDSATFSGDKG